jgi:hypothetical protein
LRSYLTSHSWRSSPEDFLSAMLEIPPLLPPVLKKFIRSH